jgi:hypothetical protein
MCCGDPSKPMTVKNRNFMIDGKDILELSLNVKGSRDYRIVNA